MRWATSKIADIAEVVTKGTTPTTYGMPFVDSGVNFIKAEALNGDSALNSSGFAFVSESTHEKLKRSILAEGDVLVTIAGAQVGRCGIVRTEHLPANTNQAVGIIRVSLKRANPWFVYYFFKNPQTFRMCQGIGSQAAQPNINLTVLKGFDLPLPALRTQDAIVEVLSAYDDLIENNRRRITLLEEAARLLYREWFVHFRFPGHQHAKIIDGVPEGWERSEPSGIIANHIGGGWGKDEPQGKEGEPAFVIRGTDIPRVESGDMSSVGLRFHGATSLLSRVLVPYDVVFEVSGGSSSQPIARTLLLTEERLRLWNSDVICASFCKKFTFSTAADALYFIFHIREYRDRGDVLVYQKESASSLKNFNFDGFMSSYELLVPPISLRKLFFESIDPIVRHQSVLARQIQQLTQARDLLLPRLIDGEIAV